MFGKSRTPGRGRQSRWGGDSPMGQDESMESPNRLLEERNFSFHSQHSYMGGDFSQMATPERDNQVFVVPVRGSETPLTRSKLPGIHGSATPDVQNKLKHAGTENVQEVALRMYRVLKANGLVSEAEKAFESLNPDSKNYNSNRGPNELHGKDDSKEELLGMDYILKDGIVNYLRDVAKLSPPIPQQVVRFMDINYTAMIPSEPQGYETFGGKLFNCFFGLCAAPFRRKGKPERLDILKDLSGYVMPGSMTLLLGPPGSGKSSLLKVLAGKAQTNKTTHLEGTVLYNDRDASEILLTRLIAYINGQLNKHLPFLTVRETLQFAEYCTQGLRPETFSPQMRKFFAMALVEGQDPFLEYILHVLGLKSIENQLVGAGQDGITENDRNRLTTAEIALGTYSVMLYDQPVYGQESLATYDLVSTLRAISRIQQCSAVMSLVQLSSEVFDLFDRVILIGEGEIIYQGPRQDVIKYFERLGFKKPGFVDAGDFLMEIAAGEGAQYLEGDIVAPSLQNLVDTYKLTDMFKDIERIVRCDDVLHTFWVESEPNLGLSVRKRTKLDSEEDKDSPDIEVMISKLGSSMDRSRGIESTGHVQIGDVVTGISTAEGDLYYLAVGSKNDQRNRASSVAALLSNARGHVRLQIERHKDPENLEEEEMNSEQFSRPFIQNWKESTKALIERQLKVTRRLTFLIQLRLIQVIILGLFAGTIFWKFGGVVDLYKINAVRGLGFVTTMNLCMIGLVQLPLYMMQRPIFYKQRDQRFFRASSYVVSHAVVNIPQSILEALVYSLCVYFMAGLTLTDHGVYYFQYLLVLVLTGVFGTSLVFMLSAISPILEVGNSLAGLFVSLFLLFSGFVIFPSNMPKYWKWAYYANPLRWANLAFCSSQIVARYPQPCIQHMKEIYFCVYYPEDTVGRAFLDYYDLEPDQKWFWISMGVLLTWTIMLNIFAFYGYKRLQFTAVPTSLPKQTDRVNPALMARQIRREDNTAENASTISWAGFVHQAVDGKVSSNNDQESGSNNGSGHLSTDQDNEDETEEHVDNGRLDWKSSNIPVKPMTLSFHNLGFHWVDSRTETTRVMLSSVSGYAKPGRMLALMGGNKSGKTTLLKCLANRAGPGRITGEILVNGYKLNPPTFLRAIGFAERLDAHQPFLTVKESLEFSAALRLGDKVKVEKRALHNHVILDLLELVVFKDTLVGSLRDPTGKTFEVAKKLTIAVELAANPSILFLDEPTSGLDSLGARNIIHAIQTIAGTGRTVITTIQHPSARMLSAFNSVIILRPGGEQVYFGPVGWNCSQLLEYFASIPKLPRYDDQQNPITYVLDVLGAGIKRRDAVYNFAEVYQSSPLASLNAEELNQLRKQIKKNAPKPVESEYTATYSQQAAMVFLRTNRFLWRNVKYTFGRLTGNIMVGLLLGTLYFQIPEDKVKTLTSKSLFIYIQVMLVGITSATNIVPQLGTDRLAYFRERRASMYAPIFYPISWAIAEIPYLLLASIFLVSIGNGMAGIGTDSIPIFFQTWMAVFLFSLCVAYFGMMITIVTPVPMLAAFAVSIVTSIWVSGSGVVVPRPRLNQGYLWMYWSNPFQYVTNTLTALTFYCKEIKSPECLSCKPMLPCPACPCNQIKDLLYSFGWTRMAARGISYDRIPFDFAMLGGMTALFAFLAFLAFVSFRHNR